MDQNKLSPRQFLANQLAFQDKLVESSALFSNEIEINARRDMLNIVTTIKN